MYANEAEVRRLAKNVKQAITTEEVASAEFVARQAIDARLTGTHLWPVDSRGVDLRLNPPPVIVQIANLLTAGILEHRSYAQVDGGEARRGSYGAYLQAQGESMLESLANGTLIDTQIERILPLRDRAAPQVHIPVTGFRQGRPRWRLF